MSHRFTCLEISFTTLCGKSENSGKTEKDGSQNPFIEKLAALSLTNSIIDSLF
jgi:hypothetical protein